MQADQKGIELVCAVQPEVPEEIVADPTRLRQILTNLLGNAIKFTQRGEVGVHVALESHAPNQAVLEYTVHDTGIGIPPDKQRLIFEAFTQLDGSTARKYCGTGLGLTISSRLVKMMGGRLWVESQPGQGSRFHFTTQVRVGERRAVPAPLKPDRLRDMRVLVVDDNATNRSILAAMLQHWGMKPELAASGHEALEELRQAGEEFALLLTDMNMPEMDGFTLVEHIRRQTNRRLPAIMMLTSAGQRGDAARCRELGIAACLIKPVGQSQLLDAILSVLGGETQ